jgi:hypothetical protein
MPPFDIDTQDADYRRCYRRPAIRISIETFDGEVIQTIDLPELTLTRDEISPAWLALEEQSR